MMQWVMLHRRILPVWALVATVLTAMPCARAEPRWPDALQGTLERELRKFDGEVALYVRDLATGETLVHNGDTPFYLASGVKILVLIAVFEQLFIHNLRFEDTVLLTAADMREGAHVITPQRIGSRVSVAELVAMMMEHSDNAATDMLIKQVGIESVNTAVQRYAGPSFGLITSMLDVRRNVYGNLNDAAYALSPEQFFDIGKKPLPQRGKRFGEITGAPRGRYTWAELQEAFQSYYALGLNSATLAGVGALLEALARGMVIDAEVSRQILDIMAGCRTGENRIRAGLPDDITLAHKTGTQYRRLCDLGVAQMPDETPVVFAICLKEFSNQRAAENLVARLASRAFALLKPLHLEPTACEP
jgi:beta-lactamase class A